MVTPRSEIQFANTYKTTLSCDLILYHQFSEAAIIKQSLNVYINRMTPNCRYHFLFLTIVISLVIMQLWFTKCGWFLSDIHLDHVHLESNPSSTTFSPHQALMYSPYDIFIIHEFWIHSQVSSSIHCGVSRFNSWSVAAIIFFSH